MKDLRSFFLNPFSDFRITLPQKNKFGESTIQLISAQNTGNRFDALLNDTIAVHTALFGNITDVLTNAAIRQARTQSVDAVISRFTRRNSRLNKYLLSNDTDKLPVYQEFFPLGIMDFTRTGVNKGNVEQKMEALIKAIEYNITLAGGSDVLQEYRQMLADYKAARGEQLNKTSMVSSGITARNQSEAAWDIQMYKNLHVFAGLHPAKPEALSLYMNQSILHSPKSAASDGRGRITGTITGADGLPLQKVKVHVVDANIKNVYTDANGRYLTYHMPIGLWKVEYSQNGTILKTENVEVVDKGNTVKDVVVG